MVSLIDRESGIVVKLVNQSRCRLAGSFLSKNAQTIFIIGFAMGSMSDTDRTGHPFFHLRMCALGGFGLAPNMRHVSVYAFSIIYIHLLHRLGDLGQAGRVSDRVDGQTACHPMRAIARL